MTRYYDDLETRSADERAAALAQALPQQIARAQGVPGYGGRLSEVDAARIVSVQDLAALPVLRKSDLGQAQAQAWAQAPAPPDEFSDPNLTPLPTHPGIKYVARTLAATYGH